MSADVAAAWAGLDLDAASALTWMRTVSEDPEAVIEWRAVGVTDPAVAASYIEAGVSTQEVGAWAAVSITEAHDVLLWRQRWDVATANQWCASLGVAVGLAWDWFEATDDDINDAKSWHAAGILRPEDRAAWLTAGCGANEATHWRRAEVAPEQAQRWMSAGYSPDAGARWAEIVASPLDADRWASALGASAPEAATWIRAGVTDSAKAGDLASIGLTAAAYARLREESGDRDLARALRQQAVHHAGLELDDDLITLDVTGRPEESVLEAVVHFGAAAARSGETAVKVRHDWPHLTPDAIAAVPAARYVRGGEKAQLWTALMSGALDGLMGTEPGGEPTYELVEGGSATVMCLAVVEQNNELFVPSREATSP